MMQRVLPRELLHPIGRAPGLIFGRDADRPRAVGLHMDGGMENIDPYVDTPGQPCYT